MHGDTPALIVVGSVHAPKPIVETHVSTVRSLTMLVLSKASMLVEARLFRAQTAESIAQHSLSKGPAVRIASKPQWDVHAERCIHEEFDPTSGNMVGCRESSIARKHGWLCVKHYREQQRMRP